MRLAAVIVAVLVSLGALVGVARTEAQQRQQAAPVAVESTFKGKLLYIMTRQDKENPVIIENPRFEKVGERHFIVGTMPNLGQEYWTSNLVHWVPVDELYMLVEFEGLDDYHTRVKRFQGGAEPAKPGQDAPPADGRL